MVTIREASLGEAAELAGVQERASVDALAHIFPPDRYPYPRAEVQARWDAHIRDADVLVLVAEDDDRIVGFACVKPEWLEALYVDPGHWSNGIGSGLHDRALEQLRTLGASRCHLWVLDENRIARRFYERRGWRQNGSTRVVEYPPHPLDVGYTRELQDPGR
jgi:GNAT superfamily N-acetyltransferase